MEKNTDDLLNILKTKAPGDTDDFIRENSDEIFNEDRPFAKYIRELLRKHGKTQQEVITKSGFPDKYGYALLSEDKHTKNRDYIIRICISGEFSLDEAQRVLTLYGMNPLYPRLERDAVIISFIVNGIYDIERINISLSEKNIAKLSESE